MELVVKHYEEPTRDELYEILKIRVAVFVVEQNCPYQEVDGKDLRAYHIFAQDESGIRGYLRVFQNTEDVREAFIGRVLALRRRQGLASQLLAAAIGIAREQLGAQFITLEAQTYARGLYEKAGFRQVSEEFLEDGIPHIRMQLELV